MFKGGRNNPDSLPQVLVADLQALQQAGHLSAAEAAEVLHGIQQAQCAIGTRRTDPPAP